MPNCVAATHESPFATAEEAWFWTVGALRARHNRTDSNSARVARPCDPDDVLLCMDRLYRNHRITLSHARALRTWGERQEVPTGTSTAAADRDLWHEAFAQLAPVLRSKGIVR
jgi:hypothetical protein